MWYIGVLLHIQLQWKSPDYAFIYLHTQLIYWEMLVFCVAPQQGIFVFLLTHTLTLVKREDTSALLCEPAELW